jgi:hypothetical protein
MAYDSTSFAGSNSVGYGKKPFPLGPCSAKADTLFADKQILVSLNAATFDNIANATCVSIADGKGAVTAYAISVPLPSVKGYSWCIDSQGASKQISGTIKGAVCK